MAKILTLNRNHFLYFLVMVPILVVIIIIFIGPGYWRYSYAEFVAPKMQKLFGFTAEWRSIPVYTYNKDCGNFKIDYHVVTSINPSGPLARMGFEIGDVPRGFTAFYEALQKVGDGKSFSIEVFKLAEAEKGQYIMREIIISK